jgi:hypothetical protein
MNINSVLTILFFCGLIGYILILRGRILSLEEHAESYRCKWRETSGKYLKLIHEFEIYKAKKGKEVSDGRK